MAEEIIHDADDLTLKGGKLFLYVLSAAALFALRPKLPVIKRRLSELPGAPKRLNLRLEIHAS